MYRLLQLLLLMPLSVMALEPAQMQSLQSLRQTAENFLQQQASAMKGEVRASIEPLDPRLRLVACDGTLDAFWPKGGRRVGVVSVGLRCQGGVSWSIYVRGKLEVYAPVTVAARPLSRGEHLTAMDVEIQQRDVSRLSGSYYSSLDEVTGMEIRRSVRAGMVLDRSVIRPPLLVKRGERVSITASRGQVSVSMGGKALDSGAEGELIEVVNLSSRQKLEAEVVAPGVVRVRM